jgi:WD40 repeat protein
MPIYNIRRKAGFQMKITMTLLTFFALFSPITPAQESTHLNLPEGAVARLGKGSINAVQYSPDGARLAVATSIGIWLYDTTTYREVALLAGHTDDGYDVAFSPDGATLASGSWDSTVLLWKIAD